MDAASIAMKKYKELEARYKETFNRFDKDGSGSISASELKAAIKEMGVKDFTDEKADAMIASADSDKSGQIEWEEFKAKVLPPCPK